MEDCSRLTREAEESLPIVQVVGQALMLLTSTALRKKITTPQPGGSVPDEDLSADAAALVSAEASSVVAEAEGLVDGLLRVIQVTQSCQLFARQHVVAFRSLPRMSFVSCPNLVSVSCNPYTDSWAGAAILPS